MEGETQKVGGKPDPAPKERIIPVGFNRRRAELDARAYPERAAQITRAEQVKAKKSAFWSAVGADRAVKLRVRGGEVQLEPTDDQHR